MADTPKVYVICDQNCKYESLTREQILTAIMQAVESGTFSNIDAGFVQTIKTINGHALKFFVGEQSEYDTLTEADKAELFAIITNDTTKSGLLDAIATLQTDFYEFKRGIESGAVVVPRASTANKASLYTLKKKYILGLDESTNIGVWYDLGTMPDGKTVNDIMFVAIKYLNSNGWCTGFPPVVSGVNLTQSEAEKFYYKVAFQIANGVLQYKIDAYATEIGGNWTYKNADYSVGALDVYVFLS